MNNHTFFTTRTQAIFYNLKPLPIQLMLDFDFLCQRDVPSVAAIVHPGRKGFHKAFFGGREILIPVYDSLAQATVQHPAADVLINFASFRSAYGSSREALLSPTLRTIVIVAEGIPERQTRELIALSSQQGKLLLGPSTVGGIAAGKFRIANAGGLNENILRAKLYRPGSVGLVSKSGGMMNELFNIIARASDGIYEGVAIGGDVYPGSTLLDHLLRFERDPNIKLLVAVSELGGKDEYDLIRAKQEGKLTKPIIMWVSGTCATIFPWEVQFGHAGAKAGKEEESAQAKNSALRAAGIFVPDSFEQLEGMIQEQYLRMVDEKIIVPKVEVTPPTLPMDYAAALRKGVIRKATNFTTTISSDVGEEVTYGTMPISEIVAQHGGIGDVISLLWFRKKLPQEVSKFIELCIIITADHGPAVSGAHNAIVAARAGKDVISSLCSGLLTIGPRFGGALDDAARYFKAACDAGTTPAAFVEEMKQKGLLIPGIGHRVKSKRNPDKRVELLKDYAQKNFSSLKYISYALDVEKVTLQKAENLILNVDGCIAVAFLDALQSAGYGKEELQQFVEIGYLNGLFALSRSIGLIGHILDQKRLNAELYRHPTEDILYVGEK